MNPQNQLEAFTLILRALEDSYIPSLKPKARKKFFGIMDASLRSATTLIYPIGDIQYDSVVDDPKDTSLMRVLRRAMIHYYGDNKEIPNRGAGKIPEWANDCKARAAKAKRAPKK